MLHETKIIKHKKNPTFHSTQKAVCQSNKTTRLITSSNPSIQTKRSPQTTLGFIKKNPDLITTTSDRLKPQRSITKPKHQAHQATNSQKITWTELDRATDRQNQMKPKREWIPSKRSSKKTVADARERRRSRSKEQSTRDPRPQPSAIAPPAESKPRNARASVKQSIYRSGIWEQDRCIGILRRRHCLTVTCSNGLLLSTHSNANGFGFTGSKPGKKWEYTENILNNSF